MRVQQILYSRNTNFPKNFCSREGQLHQIINDLGSEKLSLHLESRPTASFLEKQIFVLLESYPKEKRKCFEDLINKQMSLENVLPLIISQSPVFYRTKLAMQDANRLQTFEEVKEFCKPGGRLHMYNLSSELTLFLILQDLNKKSYGEAIHIFYQNSAHLEEKILKHLVWEVNSCRVQNLHPNHGFELIFNRQLSIEERVILAQNAIAKLSKNRSTIVNFCKPNGKLRKFYLPEKSVSLSQLLKDLDKQSKGMASKTYFSKESTE